MSVQNADFFFSGISQPVRFTCCASLIAQARIFFQAWPFIVCPCGEENPVITVREIPGEEECYRIDACWLSSPLKQTTQTCILCDLAIEMIEAFRAGHGHLLCLHGAAVAGSGKDAVLLLGDNRSGKSSLVVRLMAEGLISYGDDLVGVTSEHAVMSFGVPPRLRLPLPPSEILAAFVRSHPGIGDGVYQYLDAEVPLAGFGQSRPLGRIVILQRHQGVQPRFVPLAHNETLLDLLPRYIMREGEAPIILEQAGQMAQLPTALFQYSDLDEAARYLIHELDNPDRPTAEFPDSGNRKQKRTRSISFRHRHIPETEYVQVPSIHLHMQNGECFLTDASGNALYHLNVLGQAVWRMLAAPLSEAEAVRLLRQTFPRIPGNRIAHDMERLFFDLRQANLVYVRERKKGV